MDEYDSRVLALDPGGTTGWATYTESGKFYNPADFTCGQLGPEKHHEALKVLLGNQRTQSFTVVCERFNDRVGEHSVDLMAREYIGTVETFCQEEGVPLTMQMPAYAKGFITDSNLRYARLWAGRKNKHAMDAYKHLLAFMIHGVPHRYDWLREIGKGPR